MPIPEPGPGEVRVRVVASGLNPTDVKSRAGSRPMGFPRVVPHQDGAGVIDKVGRGVPASRVGERVWLYIVQWQRAWGTAAEYTVVPARLAVTLPANTTFAEGACLGIPAVTAHRCLFADGSISGQTVLVTGGAGAVGHHAVQLAKWAGATVIATVSSAEKAANALAAFQIVRLALDLSASVIAPPTFASPQVAYSISPRTGPRPSVPAA